jgi:1-aminocyclopropane-1-carboxylate deaminase
MNLFESNIHSPLEEINLPILNEKSVKLYLKRDDLIHPEISGNKWRKLKYNIKYFQDNTYEGILSFGGAYSNHIAALAFACNLYKIPCIGIIRGEEVSNYTLEKAKELGMKLHFVSRDEYRKRNDLSYQELLKNRFPNYYIIPEGGTNSYALEGTSEITSEFTFVTNYIACPVGTGGTIAGIIKNTNAKVLGFPALKGDFLHSEIEKLLLNKYLNWKLINNYEFGGYAKINIELFHFVNQFKSETGIALDYIYNGKMMYGLLDLISNNYFEKNAKIIAIHTGGLQGNMGIDTAFSKNY